MTVTFVMYFAKMMVTMMINGLYFGANSPAQISTFEFLVRFYCTTEHGYLIFHRGFGRHPWGLEVSFV